MKRFLLLLCALLPPSLLAAQTLQQLPSERLRQVRVEHENALELAQELELAGFDVLEGSAQPGSLELIVTDTDFQELRRMGLPPVLISVGRPFREIQAERAGVGPAEMPPVGYPDLAEVNSQMPRREANFANQQPVHGIGQRPRLGHQGSNVIRQVVEALSCNRFPLDWRDPACQQYALLRSRHV